jgi:FdrA protein
MIVSGKVIRDRYQDSVRLMRLGESKRSTTGVAEVGLIMGTPQNLDLLREAGLAFEGIETATANDIVIAVRGLDVASNEDLVDELELALDTPVSAEGRESFESLSVALSVTPGSLLGFVATPGAYAAVEARKFIEAGHPVFLYSDNVSIEAEVGLKLAALEAKTIVMGPDAGTGSLGGVKIGFSNEVRPGPIGIVAASGTGAQAISVRLDQAGSGVSHIVGVGGRDLTDDIGGLSAASGLTALLVDDQTEVICLIAKDVGTQAARRLVPLILGSSKPIVVYVQHGVGAAALAAAGADIASSLSDAATRAVASAGRVGEHRISHIGGPPLQGHLRGLFAGGTLAAEAAGILHGLLESIDTDDVDAAGHSIIDLGDDKHTAGRPHPMIAPSIQAELIGKAIEDSATGAVLFDIVLGFGAHDSPEGVISGAIAEAVAKRPGPPPALAGIVIGTEHDPQSRSGVVDALNGAGVTVFDDVGIASIWAAGIQAVEAGVDEPASWLMAPDRVVVVGTDWFVSPLLEQGAMAVHVDWRPPAQGSEALASILKRLG